jgi:hypothetical protein
MPKTRGSFTKNDPRRWSKGRLPVGQSLAERIRARSGRDGEKIVETYEAIIWRRFPALAKQAPSSRVQFVASIEALASELNAHDRLSAFEMWVERGFPAPKTDVEHSGEVTIRWQD